MTPHYRAMLALAMLASVAVALVPMASSDAADDREPDDTYWRYTIKFASTSTDWLYLRWDFGDGTVLDGRWEAYREAVEAGDALPDGVAEGFAAYSELLRDAGGFITNPVHTYRETGLYDWSIESYNPLGYVRDGFTYDGIFVTDFTGYDGGLLSGSEEESVRGSYSRAGYLMAVMGYPTISFDTHGGPEMAPVVVENTDVYASAVRPEDPVWEGHDFQGWYTDESLVQEYSWSARVVKPITLHARWSDSPTYEHTVTYMYGESVLKTQSVTTGSASPAEVVLDPPAGLSRAYHTLDGWESGGVVYKAGDCVDVPDTGLVLRAHWTENTLTFQPIGQTQAYEGQEGSFEVLATADPAGPTVSYSVRDLPSSIQASVDGSVVRFVGSDVGTFVFTVVASADDYVSASATATVNIEPIPLYDHEIVYMDGEEVVHSQIDRNSVPGLFVTHVSQPELEPKPFHVLAGWVDSDGVVYTQGSEITVPAGQKVLTALWEEKRVSLAPVSDLEVLVGGSTTFSPAVSSVPEGARVGLSVSGVPAGLDVSVDGRIVTVTARAAGEHSFSLAAFAEDYYGASVTVTVKAVSPVARAVHFIDGGKEVATQPVSGVPGEISVVLASGYSVDGKSLRGWSVREGGGVDYRDGDSAQVPADGLTLYAVWDAPFDWVPWLVMALGVLSLAIGLFYGRWELVLIGATAIALGLVDVLGIFNTFWWWE